MRVRSEDSEHKSNLVMFYITELFPTGIGLFIWGSNWTTTKGLETFISLIQLLLNAARHNASRFFFNYFLLL